MAGKIALSFNILDNMVIHPLQIEIKDGNNRVVDWDFESISEDSKVISLSIDQVMSNDKISDSKVHMDLPDGTTCSVKTDAEGRVCVEDFLKLEKWFNGRFIERIRGEI